MQKTNHWLARRTNFFYGWVILPVSILTAVFTSPGQTYMVSVFNPSFRETLDLSLSQLTGAYMFGTILASLPQSYVGVWIDRLGIRKVSLAVITAFSLACIFISQVNSLVAIFFAFFFLRMFGQGALELLSTNMLPMWFREKLGTISGFKNVAINLLISSVPISILALIKSVGWRNTYIIAGAAVFGVMAPVVFFFFINRPEEIGQIVDGNPHLIKKDEEAAMSASSEVVFTLKMAMRTRTYWILTGAWFSWAAIATGITFNLLPIFTAKGFTEEQAAATFSALMVVSAAFQIIGGLFADWIKLNYLAFSGLALYAAAVLVLALVSSNVLIPIYTGILGFAQGVFGGLGNTIWVRYFGRQHLGKIRGSVWTATVAGSSVGPFLMGLSYDQSGSFLNSLLVIASLLVCLAVAGLWATAPAKTKFRTA
jgi:sugar phosphate permease